MTGARSSKRRPEAPVDGERRSLPPTARKILGTAKDILQREGLDGLTLDAIAREAQVNKAATHYHFGSKAGLIEAIVDEIVLEECASMAHDISPDASLDERLDSLMGGVRRMALDPASVSGFFDILPHALHSAPLRERLARLYDVWFQWNLEWAGLGHDESDVGRDELKAMGRLIAAAVDGIAVQAAIGEKTYDPEPTLRTLRHCLKVVLARPEDADDGHTDGAASGAAARRGEVVR